MPSIAITSCILLIFYCRFFVSSTNQLQNLISEVINHTLTTVPTTSFPNKDSTVIRREDQSYVEQICDGLSDENLKKKTLCCTPSDVIHLYHVMYLNHQIKYFQPKPAVNQTINLPPITSVKMQSKINFKLPVIVENKKFSISDCKSYFEGTLHVIGRSTTKNVYHAVSDNFIPLVAQILIDKFLSPSLLHLPRMLYTGSPSNQASRNRDDVPHMQLTEAIMSGGYFHPDKMNGMCFKRIVWGHGPHVLYVDTLVQLRRMTSTFARYFVMKYYDLKQKSLHNWTSKNDSKSLQQLQQSIVPTWSYNSDGNLSVEFQKRPMNIIFYSRGSSGKGRSMQNEELLVNALQGMGYNAILCCDYQKTTFQQQLAYAIEADAIIGLHGAAIVHGIFMSPGTISLELKTLYGFDSILFALVADARMGLHAQVDVRKFFTSGGHKPMNITLVNRTIRWLHHAMEIQQNLLPAVLNPQLKESVDQHIRPTDKNKIGILNWILLINSSNILVTSSESSGDIIVGPMHSMDRTVHDVLGPMQNMQSKICIELLFNRLRHALNVKGHSFHCDICKTYVVRN